MKIDWKIINYDIATQEAIVIYSYDGNDHRINIPIETDEKNAVSVEATTININATIEAIHIPPVPPTNWDALVGVEGQTGEIPESV